MPDRKSIPVDFDKVDFWVVTDAAPMGAYLCKHEDGRYYMAHSIWDAMRFPNYADAKEMLDQSKDKVHSIWGKPIRVQHYQMTTILYRVPDEET